MFRCIWFFVAAVYWPMKMQSKYTFSGEWCMLALNFSQLVARTFQSVPQFCAKWSLTRHLGLWHMTRPQRARRQTGCQVGRWIDGLGGLRSSGSGGCWMMGWKGGDWFCKREIQLQIFGRLLNNNNHGDNAKQDCCVACGLRHHGLLLLLGDEGHLLAV